MPKLSYIVVGVLFASTTTVGGAEVDFRRDIRPILSANCFLCHGPDESSRQADLRLDDEADAKRDRDGKAAVVPGKPERSALIERIESTDPDVMMPPPQMHKTIAPREAALLKAWIRAGAPWGRHWSYERVERPAVPVAGESQPIDAFLAVRLEREGLAFATEADAATLVRRTALDLTGLPPTLDELERFTRQAAGDRLSAASYEAMVDYYLAKPAFGEHWARMWLDLARYADSAGYPSDPGREIWAYRDWVVHALNANMPFDRFTIEQLAGDLLPAPTDDQLTATAFHRNTMTNNEGGTNDEEFRTAAVVDRVNTTFAVWMGTTMACAQCHTHKYDPLSQTEYFQAYAFFNQSADADKKDESPIHELVAPEVKRRRAAWSKESAALTAMFASPTAEWLAGFDEWLAGKPTVKDAKVKDLLKLEAKRTPEQTKTLQQFYAREVSPAAVSERERLAELTKKLADTKPPSVPVMLDLETSKRRKTYVQLRGNWEALGDEVHEGTPAAFPPLPADGPRDRLMLARWLVHRDNPLTARVMVNRLWESIFGVGIVRSSEEFGSQGDAPVHPELLDWLAAEFMESGWDLKHVLKQMLSSRAYRQTSAVALDVVERDPDNRFLARGPRFRPTGEQLRDQALAVSGLLSGKMFGPAVRPLRPNLGLNTAFGGANDWTTSAGEDRHRRSLYTEVRRNSPYPGFATFDAPNREVCTLRRGRTNTPLQALASLNDPVFVEAAQALARRLTTEGGSDPEAMIRFSYRLCLCREPDGKDAAVLKSLYDDALSLYRSDAALATKMATEPLGPAAAWADVAELAAWTVVSNVLLNLDEFLMRR